MSRPTDIVLVSDDHVILLELSVASYYNSEDHFKAEKKLDMHGPLISDLELAGFTASLVTIEVGCLVGHFLQTTVTNICKVCHLQKNCV